MTELHKAIEALGKAPKTNIKGKAYTQVATRVEVFRAHFGLQYGLLTELLPTPDENLVRVRASITNGQGEVLATGMAEEDRRNGNINRTSALENCETSAIGRALAAFGLHGGEYATANEVEAAVAQQEKPKGGAKPVTGRYAITELKQKAREVGGEIRNQRTHGDFDSLLSYLNDNATREVMDQLSADLPEWWFGDGKDSQGLKGLIDTVQAELAEKARQQAEYEPAQ